MGLIARLIALVIFLTLLFVTFGVVTGIAACASVQGFPACIKGVLASLNL